MQDCLGLVGDGDELDVIVDVERTFGIVISNQEAEAIRNVGDLYDLIELRVGPEKIKACHSQVAFYALRRALVSMGADKSIAPATPVAKLRASSTDSIARWWSKLGRQSGLRLPPLETPFVWQYALPHWARYLIFCLTAGAVGLTALTVERVMGISGGYAFMAVLVGAGLISFALVHTHYLVYRDIPARLETLGDLAREAAGFSFSEMRQSRYLGSRYDRWYALEAILRPLSGYKLPIKRSTTFIAPR